jgi:hypothetical protein
MRRGDETFRSRLATTFTLTLRQKSDWQLLPASGLRADSDTQAERLHTSATYRASKNGVPQSSDSGRRSTVGTKAGQAGQPGQMSYAVNRGRTSELVSTALRLDKACSAASRENDTYTACFCVVTRIKTHDTALVATSHCLV